MMTLFSWLFIGHLIGDWILQSDWMALGKRQALITKAGMSHFLVYTLTILLVLWVHESPPSSIRLLGTIVVIFVSHWLIDATSFVSVWMRLMGQRNQPLVRMMVDQSFHLIVLAFIAQTGV